MAAEPMREDDREIYGLCASCSAPLRAWEFERDGVTVLGLSCPQEATHDPDLRLSVHRSMSLDN
jgi:hypothetical protein